MGSNGLEMGTIWAHALLTECWSHHIWISIYPCFRQKLQRSTTAILLPPRLDLPARHEATRISAASSLGGEPCVFTRRRNSSWSRSLRASSASRGWMSRTSVLEQLDRDENGRIRDGTPGPRPNV